MHKVWKKGDRAIFYDRNALAVPLVLDYETGENPMRWFVLVDGPIQGVSFYSWQPPQDFAGGETLIVPEAGLAVRP